MKQYTRFTLIAAFLLSALTACGGPCTTCQGPETGGQVMSANNTSQQIAGFLSQFYGEKPDWAK